jgi:flavorubredoxin
MNKHWAALLLAIAATQAYAGDKEYTVRVCDEEQAIVNNGSEKDCNKCKVEEGSKVNFKISKELKSVMETIMHSDGNFVPTVHNNCKIFDNDTFQCDTPTKSYIVRLTISNGKYELKLKNKLNDDGITIICGNEIKRWF